MQKNPNIRMHILLIEDQARLAENIRDFLGLETYVVTTCSNGEDGLAKVLTEPFDLLILDINLPDRDGFSICKELRESGSTLPILMLTARDDEQDIIHGLNTGADDYLTKPFSLDELLARVRALLRRGKQPREPVLSIRDITVDTNTRKVTKGDQSVDLAPKEYALLEFLLQNRGRAQSRTTILDHVWGGGDDMLLSQTVDVHVVRLRRKLGKDLIETVPGIGYLIPDDV